MRAIVLSGGGARGAYEIGVWKAFRRLGIKYDIVTGSSVGSLNGAMMVQNRYYSSIRLWKKISFETIFDNKFDKSKNFYKEYAKFFFNEGISIKNFHNLLDKYINLNIFYNSNINFGLSTVRLNDLKPILLTKNKIPREKLVDYLVASSTCYPFFPIKEIDNQKFIDGGFYDNMPINLAIDMGATEIIAVYLDALGPTRKPKDQSIPVTYIISHNDIGSPYDFNKDNAKKAIKYGYNDTMKVYKKLEGNIFTFRKNHLKKNYEIYKTDLTMAFKKAVKYKPHSAGLLESKLYKDLISDKVSLARFNIVLEKLGIVYELDQTKIYSRRKFNSELKKRFKAFENTNIKLNLKKGLVIEQKSLIKKIYMEIEKKKTNSLRTTFIAFPQEFLCALYMNIIIKS